MKSWSSKVRFSVAALVCAATGAVVAETDPSGSVSRFFPQEQQRPHARRPAASDAAQPPHRGQKAAVIAAPRVSGPATVVPRAIPALVVAVYGDRFAQVLAGGLEDDAGAWLAVAASTSDDGGLARPDFNDWLGSLRERLRRPDRPPVAVIMLGSNDRQAMADGQDKVEPASPRWQTLYAARIDAVASAFHEARVALVWLGLPSVRDPQASADFVRLNALFRDRAGKDDSVFVDSWEAFSDDTGMYSAMGPDIDGRTVKLRKADGFGFTRAGARKLASFVEPAIKRFSTPPPVADTTTPAAAITIEKARDFDQALNIDVNAQIQREAALAAGREATTIEPPATGPVLSLTAPPLSPDGTLAIASLPSSNAVRGMLGVMEDAASAAHPGRADDFSWPRPGRADDFSWPRPAQ